MERKNAELCCKNIRIMFENDRLRKKAQQLERENKVLLARIKQSFTDGESIPVPEANFGENSSPPANQIKSKNPSQKKF